jgi:hypothetical protein
MGSSQTSNQEKTMTINSSVFVAAFVAAGLAFSPVASALEIHIDEDLSEMSDKDLAEAKEGIEEGLEEIQEGREEIQEERDDGDAGKIESAALAIADTALEAAEEALEEILEEIEEEQASRK